MAKKATARSRPIDMEIVDDPGSPDQQLVATDGDKLREFLGGLTKFFSRAAELERGAKERLDRARQFKPPTDAVSDEKIQIFIRESKTEIKVADDYWTIAAVLHHLHRTVTAARSRTTGKDSKGVPIGMLDQAVEIAQQLHNRYVEDENRKARIEQDRLRQEAEERGRLDRERELAQLEEAALKAEAADADLSERETTFAQAVADGYNAALAARTAGFKDPDAQAVRLLKTPKVVKAIEGYRGAANLRKQATAMREMPVNVETPLVRPNVTKAAGGFDRTTYSADVYDPEAFIAALLDTRTRTQLGIPADVVTFLQPKMNDLAKSMKELIEKWPGVRLKKNTTTV